MMKAIPVLNNSTIKMLVVFIAIILLGGCCALPDIPGPIGIPGC